ncbi:MAG: RCC1 domain-containing protein, partial [Gammaproteobacteria bacterium]
MMRRIVYLAVLLGFSAPGLVAQPASSTVYTQIAAGNGYSCALAAGGIVWCWGKSEFGIFGDSQGSLVPVALAGGTKFKSITSGSVRMCGLTETGDAYCWGSNRDGVLGARSGRDCILQYSGRVECAKQPLKVSGGLRFDRLASGATHTCGLSGSTIYCWGANHQGQLGDGSKKERSAPVQVSGGLQFESVFASGSSSCGRVGGQYYCWGSYPRAPIGEPRSNFSPTPVLLEGMLAQVIPGACGLSLGGAFTCRGELLDAMTHIGVGGVSVTFDEPKLVRFSSGSSGHSCG